MKYRDKTTESHYLGTIVQLFMATKHQNMIIIFKYKRDLINIKSNK